MAYPISDVPRRIVYSGSAGVGPYAFTFEVLANTDIAVYKNTTLLTLTTDYTVTINTGTGTGTVTLVVAATGADTVTIVGDRAIQRTSDFVTGGDLFANTLNDELDSQTIYVQQVDEKADRAIRAPVTDPTTINMVLPSASDRADKLLRFGSTGNPVASTLGSIGGTVTDSSLVEFLQAGTGAVTRTAQSKMRDVVSVKDFGAVGDANPISGTGTDDTAAIQAAINAVSSGHDQQRAVFFPDGTYRITSTLTLPEGVELFGNGAWKSKIHYAGAGVAIQWSNGGSYDFPQIVRDIALYTAGTYCIRTGTASGGIIRDVWFGGPGGIEVSGTADIQIVDNVFDDTLNGIVFTAATLCNNIEIGRNSFTGNAFAITLKNARDVRINGNAFRGDSSHNIHILCPSGANTLIGVVINGNTFYTAAGTGAVGSLVCKLEGSAVSNVVISNNTIDGARGNAFYTASGNVSGILFVGNIFNNIGDDIISFIGVGNKISVKNNIFNAGIGGKCFNFNNTGAAVFTGNEVYSANGLARTSLDSTAVDVQQATLFVARNNSVISTAINYGFVIRSTVTTANANDNIISGATVSEYLIANSVQASMKLTGAISPGTLGAGTQSNGIWQGASVPSNSFGSNGDIYLRTDTPGTANQRLYIKSAGAWVATAL